MLHFYELGRGRRPEPTVAEAPAYAFDTASLYIDGIHCLGCLWLLERLPELLPGVKSAELSMAHQILKVEIAPAQCRWADVIQLLGRLGYQAHILERGADEAEKADDRRQLWRLAVAAFSTGNVMTLAAALYAGADGPWRVAFPWLSLVLAAPALTYAAWPIYRTGFGALFLGRIAVDLPIAFALLAGIGVSLHSLIFSDGSLLYFDSLCMLVFLLQASRYVLQRLRRHLARQRPLLHFLSTESYTLANSGARTSASNLKARDKILLQEGQTLPTDSRLLSPQAYFDLSLLTGESQPVKKMLGDTVESGSRLLGTETQLQALGPASEGRLASLLAQLEGYRLKRTASILFSDRVGRWFAAGVLACSLLLLAAHPSADGLQRALAFVIVTCPCVLAFAVPLALTRSLQVAASKGLLFRDSEALETLAQARHLFLDKTGTLTTGAFSVVHWNGDSEERTLRAVASLEQGSCHPVGKSLARYIEQKEIAAGDAQEIQGIPLGIKGRHEGAWWKVERIPGAGGLMHLGIYRNDHRLAVVSLGDEARADAANEVSQLKALGLSTTLLSGDEKARTGAVAMALGITDWAGELSPEEKAARVAQNPGSIMAGDGANDSLAFQAAKVGVAVQGAIDLSLRSAHLALSRPGLAGLAESILLSRRTQSLIRTNFTFTFAYNILAGSLAAAGLMEPLWAAILMPCSALTVYLFTFWRTRSWR